MLNDVASHRRGRTLGSGTKRRGSPSVTWVSAMTKRRTRKDEEEEEDEEEEQVEQGGEAASDQLGQ